MAQAIRPDLKLAQVAYKLLKTDESLQQKKQYKPTEKQKQEWASNYNKANTI